MPNLAKSNRLSLSSGISELNLSAAVWSIDNAVMSAYTPSRADPAGLGQFWLEVFNALWAGGVPVQPWWFDTAGRWLEVDVHIDIRRVRASLGLDVQAAEEALRAD